MSETSNRFRITSIIIAAVMLVGAFGVLIGPFTLNVSAAPDTHTWDGGGADAFAGTHANWVTDIAPEAGDSVVFDAGALPCWWNLSTILVSFSINAGYSGTISQNVSFTVGSFNIAAGTFTSDYTNWINITTTLHKTGGTIDNLGCYRFAGTTSYDANSAMFFKRIWISSGTLTIASTAFTQPGGYMKIDAGCVLSISASKTLLDYGQQLSTFNGTITGAGNYRFASNTGTTSWTLPSMTLATWSVAHVYMSTDGVGTTKTVTLSSDWIMSGDLNLSGGTAALTTLDVSGSAYALSASSIKINANQILNARGAVTADVVVYSGGVLTNTGIGSVTGALIISGNVTGSASAFSVSGLVTNSISGNMTQSTGAWAFGSYTQSGADCVFWQGGVITISGAMSISAGTFTSDTTNWITLGSSLTKTGGTTDNWGCYKFAGTTWYSATTSMFFHRVWVSSGTLTVNSTAYIRSGGYMKLDTGCTLSIAKTATLVDYGRQLSTFDGAVSGEGNYGFLSSTETASWVLPSMATSTWSTNILFGTEGVGTSKSITLSSDWIIGGDLYINGGSTGITTLDLSTNNYNLTANQILIVDQHSRINARGGTVTNLGNGFSQPRLLNISTDTIVISGGGNWLGPANTMVQAPNGDYLAYIRNGTTHVSPGDYAIMQLYRSYDGLTWTYESNITVPTRDVRNYASGVSATGRIFLFYSVFDTDNFTGTNSEPFHDMHYTYSDNNGVTWSASVDMVIPAIGGFTPNGSSPFDTVVLMGNNRIGVTYSCGNVTHSQTRFAYSDDDGATWTHVAARSLQAVAVQWLTEYSVVYVGNNTLVGLVRIERPYSQQGNCWMYVSTDNGATWVDRGFVEMNLGATYPPMLRTITDVEGRLWVIGLFMYIDYHYAIALAEDAVALGAAAWVIPPQAKISGYGKYLGGAFNSITGVGLFLAGDESEKTVSTHTVTFNSPAITTYVGGSGNLIQSGSNTTFVVNSPYNLTISGSAVRLFIPDERVGNNLTIQASASAHLRQDTYIMNVFNLYGALYQDGWALNISGSSAIPIKGYGTFNGDLYLNGSTSSSYTVETRPPTGYLHTDRDITINLDANHSLRAIPSTIAFVSISMISLTRWTAEASDPSTSIVFTLSGLDSGVGYKIYVDDVIIATIVAVGGQISFSYSAWSTHVFSVVRPTTYAPDEEPLPSSERSPATTTPGEVPLSWTSLSMMIIVSASILIVVVLLARRHRGRSGRSYR